MPGQWERESIVGSVAAGVIAAKRQDKAVAVAFDPPLNCFWGEQSLRENSVDNARSFREIGVHGEKKLIHPPQIEK